jgi:hypothetical protein
MLSTMKAVDDWNRLAIMRVNTETGQTKVYLINEHKGEKAFGCWFSNDMYRTDRVKTVYVGAECYGGRNMANAEYFRNLDSERAELDRLERIIRAERGNHQELHYTVDENGWIWDFTAEEWKNEKTGNRAKELEGKFIPVHVEAKRRFAAIQEQQKKDEEARIGMLEEEDSHGPDAGVKNPLIRSDFAHLTKSDRKRLFRLGVNWYKKEYPYSTAENKGKINTVIAVRCLRAALDEVEPTLGTAKELDNWLLTKPNPIDDICKLRGDEEGPSEDDRKEGSVMYLADDMMGFGMGE